MFTKKNRNIILALFGASAALGALAYADEYAAGADGVWAGIVVSIFVGIPALIVAVVFANRSLVSAARTRVKVFAALILVFAVPTLLSLLYLLGGILFDV